MNALYQDRARETKRALFAEDEAVLTAEASIEADPQYGATLTAMQRGDWQEALLALSQIEKRYPDSGVVLNARAALTLHLSAEESWADTPQQRAIEAMERPTVRALVVANLFLYLALALLATLAASAQGLL